MPLLSWSLARVSYGEDEDTHSDTAGSLDRLDEEISGDRGGDSLVRRLDRRIDIDLAC